MQDKLGTPSSAKLKVNVKFAVISMSSMLLLGILGSGAMLFNYLNPLPLLELSEMDKHEGVITSVYYSGRTKAPYFQLRTKGGEILEYSSLHDYQDKFERLVNKPVVVWSQPDYLYFGLIFDVDVVRQVQYGDVLVLDYANDYKQVIKQSEAAVAILNLIATAFFVVVLVIPSSIYLVKSLLTKRNMQSSGERSD